MNIPHPTSADARTYRAKLDRLMTYCDTLAEKRMRVTRLVEAHAKTYHVLMMAITGPVAAYEQAARDEQAAMQAVEQAVDEYANAKIDRQ